LFQKEKDLELLNLRKLVHQLTYLYNITQDPKN